MGTRVALWGGAALDNVGDRLLFDVVEAGLAQRIRRATFTRFCPWPDPSGMASSLWVDSAGRWPGTGAFDCVVVIGGVFAGPPFLNVMMQAFTLGASPAEFDWSARVAWHGVGLDDHTPPGGRDDWDRYLHDVAARVDKFTVRAANAAQRFAAAGARVPEVVPDPAFALRAAAGTGGQPKPRTPRICVAVGDMTVSGRLTNSLLGSDAFGEYVSRSGFDRQTCLSLADVAAHELDADVLDQGTGFADRLGRQIADLSQLGEMEFLAVDNMYDDQRTAARLAAGATVHSVRASSAEALTQIFGRYDLVVASRLHSIVLALRAGVRVVAVDPYWSLRTHTSKVHQLLLGLGMIDRHWTYQPGTAPGPSLADLAAKALTEHGREALAYQGMRHQAVEELDALAAFIQAA